ncbi:MULTISPECIES: imidazole glycerol phosphate synthase subunit HisH [unclassified Clostridium]|uniref:imidazole glycerol phosphate synthase subunit HisH n=1 Tax=unclassified Clostridium TaxID=2614128 RepID=UPI0002974224|nr:MULTISPECIES: imidazole glycerol phosphate synthase subunit HisH [unclassified Clostridium]EKQ51111.1 MAG: imidazole glycerol phosphate synthase, glutamine amidotransferase subunit [Clostridium sp. Maddingley MBC34-26]
MVAIVDYGMGNLGSVQNMVKKIGYDSIITSEKEIILEADKLILPGVGRFDAGMNNLKEKGLIDILNDKVKNNRTPLLGICLGMQLITNYSEEGNVKGLGWIDAETVKFRFDGNENLKVPHMGWNFIKQMNQAKLLYEKYDDSRFYFVHSYYVKCNKEENVVATTNYGFKFDSIIQDDNIVGTQFHPEKSHKFGMKVLKNFLELY